MTPLQQLIDEMKARAEKATPGDWYWDPRGANWLMSAIKTVLSASHDGNYASNVSIKKEDAEFIAHARTDFPRVLKALELALKYRDAFAKQVGINRLVASANEANAQDKNITAILSGANEKSSTTTKKWKK